MPTFTPIYLNTFAQAASQDRVAEAYDHYTACDLCGWQCQKDRVSGKMGVCRSGIKARVSSYAPHQGEERPLSGWKGSGTIFFTRCNLRCQFCQNAEISQTDQGELLEPEELAAVMMELQAMGCHNINLVSPTHFVPSILAAVYIAAKAGLHLPLVYNTGGYDSLQALRLLDGVIDIYLPDMKYANPQVALHYSKIPHYPQTNQAAVREMHRQVGDLKIDPDGLAMRGLLVRHLLMPNGLNGTAEILRFLANEISTSTYLNLMDQYRPVYQARFYSRINRTIKREEYQAAREMAVQYGLDRLDPG
ncbi:MAG: radical SAM protein [Anaerolineales bacterium]|jgi:putative pyruvate formate lyase activating enzyme|nr:radical SAM protein [Anaerolineales bacterium]